MPTRSGAEEDLVKPSGRAPRRRGAQACVICNKRKVTGYLDRYTRKYKLTASADRSDAFSQQMGDNVRTARPSTMNACEAYFAYAWNHTSGPTDRFS